MFKEFTDKTNVENIVMLNNYVLILPDPHLETFQFRGKESGLIAPDFKYEKGERYSASEKNDSVFGTVYGVPEALNYNLKQINKISRENTLFVFIEGEKIPVNIGLHRRLGELTRGSVKFDTDVEVKKGERVMFSYQVHRKCREEKMVVDTEYGEMFLMKYDMLYMVISEDNKPVRMLNGFVLVEPEQIEVLREGGQEFIEQKHGLVTLAPKSKIKKTKKTQVGTVHKFGSICRGYLQNPDKSDFTFPLKEGGKVMYDPRQAQRLEYETHQIISDKTMQLIQRKDIKYLFDDDKDFGQLDLRKETQNV